MRILKRVLLFVVIVFLIILIPPVNAQGPIPIEEIVTMRTAIIVAGALILSLIGATVAVTVRHLTSQNWVFHIQDIWYYMLSCSISVALAVMGADTITILSATTGVNTPLAIVKSTIDKYTERKGRRDYETEIQELKSMVMALEGKNTT